MAGRLHTLSPQFGRAHRSQPRHIVVWRIHHADAPIADRLGGLSGHVIGGAQLAGSITAMT